MYFDKIDLSEVTEPAKSNNRKQCMVCHYWLFNYGFEYQDSVCNCFIDLLMLCVNIINIAIIAIKDVDYNCKNQSVRFAHVKERYGKWYVVVTFLS